MYIAESKSKVKVQDKFYSEKIIPQLFELPSYFTFCWSNPLFNKKGGE